MSSLRSTLALCALLFLCTQSATAGAIKIGSNGRVSGLAVSIVDQVANGGGKDVDIQVDMTTVRSEFLGPTNERGFPVFDLFTDAEIITNRSGFGGLGDANLLSSQVASDTQGRAFQSFYYNTFAPSPRGGGSYAGIALEFTVRSANFTEGELPGLDFGDGSTVDVTSLSPTGTPVTTTSGPIRTILSRWRGTFTHTYPDLGSYTVTAASRCCPRRALPMGDDDTVPLRGFDYNVSPGYPVSADSPSALQFSFENYTRLQFESASQTQSPIFRGSESGTFQETFGSQGTGVRRAAQVTNTALVEDGLGGFGTVLAIPTASTYGLALLSLLLAAVGFLTLRR